MSCYRNILVAIDGSADAGAALTHAAILARDQHARLTVITVVPSPNGTAAAIPAVPDLAEVQAKLLREAVEELPEDVGVTTRVERGDAAETILRVAAEGRHDLIVLGSHGHSRIHRALLGSVSERVLKSSGAPVLLMRGGQPPSR